MIKRMYLCSGMESVPESTDGAIFTAESKQQNLYEMEIVALKALDGVESLILYVEDFSCELMAVMNVCASKEISLNLRAMMPISNDKGKVLIRKFKYNSSMLEVLERYGIGVPDRFNRGRWLRRKDLNDIKKSMLQDCSLRCIKGCYFSLFEKIPCEYIQWTVEGKTPSDSVSWDEFVDLFI